MTRWVGVWHPMVPQVCAENTRIASGDAGVQFHQWLGGLCVADFLLSTRLVPTKAVRQTGRGEGRRRAEAEVHPSAGGSARRDQQKKMFTCHDYEFIRITSMPLLMMRGFSGDTSRKSRSLVALARVVSNSLFLDLALQLSVHEPCGRYGSQLASGQCRFACALYRHRLFLFDFHVIS